MSPVPVDESAGRTFVLLPSIFLPPLVWGPVATELRALGLECVIAQLERPPATAAELLALYRRSLPPSGDVVLVAHSNAGNYVPLLSGTDNVVGAAFVDAVLPAPGYQPVVPPAFAHEVAPLALGGVLPPWSGWFGKDVLAELIWDADAREEFRAAQPQVPATYLSECVEVPAWSSSVPCGYLGFGDTYAEEIARAQALGWPVTVIDGGHLHLMNSPTVVASWLDSLSPRRLRA